MGGCIVSDCLAPVKPFIVIMRGLMLSIKWNISVSFYLWFNILDYAAVLTGHGVQGASTARFYFRKKTLQYSFLMGDQLGWPDELTFLDADDNILEDFSLSKTSLQNQTDKLCGAWERLPRKYRRLLRSEELFVSLATNNGLIRGKIKKYYGLNSELFSGLFEGLNGAGTAIVSVSPGTGSIHANVLFKGIAKEGQENVKFKLKFHTIGDNLINEESVVLDSASSVSIFKSVAIVS